MQGAYQSHQAPASPPLAPRSRRKRVLIIGLSVAGAFLLVIASLIVGLILTSDGSRLDQAAETNERPATVNEEIDPVDDTAAVEVTEQVEDEPPANVGNQGSAQEPANLLGGLSLFNLSDSSNQQQTVQPNPANGEELEVDPAAVRQSFVDELAALGITESEVADFLAAYDLLVSDDFMTAYAALTAEEKQAYETALTGVMEDYLESFLTDCDLSNLLSFETEATSQAELMACIIASINQLGRDIVQASEEHGLAPATTTEAQTS